MMSRKVAMFENAHDNSFKHNLFIVNEGNDKLDKLDVYLRTASVNAILNAGGRADAVRCYPGTRAEVIGKIMPWMDRQNETDRRILWLSGHAGAGKSAIAQTIAENGAERGVHAANFFFFRGENTRNHAAPLVATLVYQLIKLYPALREHLTDALTTQPLACTAAVREQFVQLLASPIENVHNSSPPSTKVTLIIDGLDECDDEAAQVQILGALHELVRKPGSPFRVMVASRVEPHIVMFFNKIADSVQSLFLNDEYGPEDDIRQFVITKFDEIKRTHYLAHTITKDWPSKTDIDKIVSKSSGQFIYAATVMRFIEYSKDNPEVSLLTTYELRPPTSHSPFAQLDALYSEVFSKARDIRPIKWAFGFFLLWRSVFDAEFLEIGGYGPTELQSLFADISAIAQISISENKALNVHVYHGSLPDYLTNKSRSGLYHLDEQEILADVCAICIPKFQDERTLGLLMREFNRVAQPTIELTECLLNASKRRIDRGFGYTPFFGEFLTQVIWLYFFSDTAMCGRILRGWVRFAYIHKFDVDIDTYIFGRISPPWLYFQHVRLTEKAKLVISHAFTGDDT